MLTQLRSEFLNRAASAALHVASPMLGGHLSRSLAEMKRAQWLGHAELNARLEARVTGIVRHAVMHVPFYREHWKHLGAGASDLTGFAALRVLPVVNKFTFRDGPLDAFVAENIPVHRRLARRTSGSTGEPFEYYIDREMLPLVYASHLFYDSWYKLRPFDRYLRIVPAHGTDTVQPGTPWPVRFRQHVTASLKHIYESLSQEFVSVWEVDRERLEMISQRIDAFQPDFLLGYTSTVALLADYLLERGRSVRHPLRGVIVIGETLTPWRRKLIVDCFCAPIINRYGLREFGAWSAQNCQESQDTFHINTEMVAVEILREDGTATGPGEAGKVVITDLFNRVMPFLRYDTGDIATQGEFSPCPCGRGLPRFGFIDGRSVESLTTASGCSVSAIVLGRYFREGGPLFMCKDHIDYIRHYQAIQETQSRVRFLVVPSVGFNDSRSDLLRADLVRLLGNEMDVMIERVREIPLEKSGKRPLIKHARPERVRNGACSPGASHLTGF